MKINLYTKVRDSLENNSKGFSLRKLFALFLMMLIVYLDIRYCAGVMESFNTVLLIHITGVFLLLGIVTVQQIIDFKNGKDENK